MSSLSFSQNPLCSCTEYSIPQLCFMYVSFSPVSSHLCFFRSDAYRSRHSSSFFALLIR
nr:MAG TPA: hypothetical protein [Caudoviricetes sp.]DAG98385.1 MAG TPA: hypothetical protein [Herelleviridae sp.]